MKYYRPIPQLSEADKMLFWSKVNRGKENECWNYLCGVSRNGYGQFYINRIQFRSNRIAYYIINNIDPLYLDVLHTCDNPRCCNPNHLFLGTHQDNMNDIVAKGKQLKGENHHFAKLTEEQVKNIRYKSSILGYTQMELAQEYNTHQTNISLICAHKIWRYV